VNGSPVASGVTRCVTDVTRNPATLREVTIAMDPFTPVSVSSGDVLALRVLTRIGTNLDDTLSDIPHRSHGHSEMDQGSDSHRNGPDVTEVVPTISRKS